MSGNLARAVRAAILAVHRRLLPASPRIGWAPYLWLTCFAFKWFFVPKDPVKFSLALTLPVFLVLYFDGYWQSGPRVFLNIAGLLVIALVWTPFNEGAITLPRARAALSPARVRSRISSRSNSASAAKIVVLWEKDDSSNNPHIEVSLPNFEDWRAQAESFADLAAKLAVQVADRADVPGLGVDSAQQIRRPGVQGALQSDAARRVRPRVAWRCSSSGPRKALVRRMQTAPPGGWSICAACRATIRGSRRPFYGEPMRKIDIFTHIFPETYVARMRQVAPDWKDIGKRVRNIPMLVELDVRFRIMDRHEGYQQILSIATPPIEVYAQGAEAADLARRANDGMAELVARYPDRFPGFVASLPYDDGEAALDEARRALDQLGARGIQMFSNLNGRPTTDDEFLPLFELMAGHDLPIWLHPIRDASFPDYKTEDKSLFEIWWTFGWPYDTSVAMARIVFAKLFDRFPNLKIITHHMGAMIPYFEGRIGPGWDQLGARTSDEDYPALLRELEKRPFEYFKMFYADTALFGAYDGTVCGLNFFGVDHVLFASDAPFDPEKGSMYIRETIGVIDRLPISAEERERIYSGNAIRLLKLQ